MSLNFFVCGFLSLMVLVALVSALLAFYMRRTDTNPAAAPIAFMMLNGITVVANIVLSFVATCLLGMNYNPTMGHQIADREPILFGLSYADGFLSSFMHVAIFSIGIGIVSILLSASIYGMQRFFVALTEELT
ncbi:MAG: hypothetical protein R3B41_02120 [Candidatus Doudnabacteria bacterium]